MKDFGTRAKLVAVLFALITLLGCGALDAGTPAAQTHAGLMATAAVVDFGTVAVGATAVRSNTITNTSASPIVLTGAQIDQADFTITGQTLPLKLAPGQRATFQIAFSPQSSGNSQSTAAFASNSNRFPGLFTLRGTAIASAHITLTPKTISFGNVAVGKTQTQSATVSNPGNAPVTITHATISGKGFALSGLTLPLTLKAGQSAALDIVFTPALGGAASGTISLVGTVSVAPFKRPAPFGGRGTLTSVALNTVSTTLSALVSGTGMASGQLAVMPASLALGSVKIGGSQTQSATLINSGSSDLIVRQATVSGRGFRMSGITFPLTLSAGQRKSFAITFTPQAAGTATGTIAVTTDSSTTVVSVPVSAVATASGALTSNPSSFSFAPAGQTLPGALTNSGGSSVTVSQASFSAAGFTVGGLSLPVTLASGQSVAFSVTYKPQSSAAASASLSFASDASNSTLAIPLVANAAAVGVLSTSDSSLDFGSVQINATGTQSETLTNSGGAVVTISQAKASGNGFSVTGLTLPLTLNPGQSFTFGAAFHPSASGSFSGSIAVVSDASDATLNITLAGVAAAPGQLAVGPAALNFGSVTVGQSKSLTGSLTASGSSITVSNASMSTSEFTIGGLTLPLTLSAGQSASFTITFKPQASGAATASATFASNASTPAAPQSLTGNGAAAPQHSVILNWNPSTSNAVGYNVYRGNTSGGPYANIASMNPDTSFTDASVQAGQTYFYVTTAVDGSGKESANSNQTQAVIPTP